MIRIKQLIQKHQPLVVAIAVFLFMMILGAVFAKVTKNLIVNGIGGLNSRYFSTIYNMEIEYWDYFKYLLWENIKSYTLIWIFSLTILGIPYFCFVVAKAGFLSGYLLSVLLSTYQWKGFLLFLVYHFPQDLIYIPVWIMTLNYGYRLTMEMNHGQVTPSLHNIGLVRKYIRFILILLLALIVGSVLETFAGSLLVKKTLGLFVGNS